MIRQSDVLYGVLFTGVLIKNYSGAGSGISLEDLVIVRKEIIMNL